MMKQEGSFFSGVIKLFLKPPPIVVSLNILSFPQEKRKKKAVQRRVDITTDDF